jgi:hypothetical protein
MVDIHSIAITRVVVPYFGKRFRTGQVPPWLLGSALVCSPPESTKNETATTTHNHHRTPLRLVRRAACGVVRRCFSLERAHVRGHVAMLKR